jgi:hypothetical protein
LLLCHGFEIGKAGIVPFAGVMRMNTAGLYQLLRKALAQTDGLPALRDRGTRYHHLFDTGVLGTLHNRIHILQQAFVGQVYTDID